MLRSTALIALCLLIFAEASSAHLYQDYDKFAGARHEETELQEKCLNTLP